MSRTDFSSFSDEALLLYALNQSQDVWTEITDRYSKRVASWCRRRAWGIPEDIRAEVTQETLFSLFTKLSDFDPDRGAADCFVFGLFRNALKKVQRMYGLRSGVEVKYFSEFDQSEFTLEETLAAQDNDDEPSADRLHTKQIAMRIMGRLDTAPSEVKQAILLLASRDEPSVSKVAALLGVNRVTLNRHIRKWAARYQYLVAA